MSIPTKIVFLDVDGVMNFDGTKTRNRHGAYGIEPVLAERVKRILRTANAGYVLSSAWRKYPDLKAEVHAALQPDGWRFGCTDCSPRGDRADEIQNWLYVYGPRGPVYFVIIDDWNLESNFPGHCVTTHSTIGITEDDVSKALRILERPATWSF
jgi:hypothetical protein